MTTQSFFQTFMIAFGILLGTVIAAIAFGVSQMRQKSRIKNAVAP
jgi:ABC-type Fe3+ transport system permease subunit